MLKNMRPVFVRILRIYCITVSLLISCFPCFSLSLFFNITSFSFDTDNIAIEGDATVSPDGDIELNTDSPYRVGRLTYAQPLLLWDSATGAVTDFSTRFSFTIADPTEPSGNLADGFAFYMAPLNFPIPSNSAALYFGLFNRSTYEEESKNNLVFVEFDTYTNPEFDPTHPSLPHVGINRNSLRSLNHSVFDIIHNKGKQGHVLITYNATTEYLTVYWSFNTSLTEFSSNCTLSHKIDLMKALPECVTIGFTAGTGVWAERHVIHSWEFNSTLNSTNSASRNSTKSIRGITESSNNVVLIVSITCSIILLIIVAFIFWYLRNRKRSKQQDDNNRTFVDSEIKAAIPREFHHRELVDATNGFTNHKKLGRGGSGQVYRGVLNDSGRVVAIKRISIESSSSKRFFINEVKIISRLIHRNLVQFIGWCHEQDEFLLVFEYMPNGSLDTHLFGNGRVLPWNLRYKIALGVVIAVRYLHEEAEQCVLHRDIKSANVLLDADFTTKLGDFGIAKLVDTKMMTQNTGLVGTLGYLAPEYINAGRATKETDIYSFGVVALEIACGRRTYQEGEYHTTLADWVWQLYRQGNVLNAADARLNMDFDVNEMKCLLTLGLWCTHPSDKERPNASLIINVLQKVISLPELGNMRDSTSHPNPRQENSNLTQSETITTSFDNVGR